jgi:predicted transposase/invertase (TIGR01784 family)
MDQIKNYSTLELSDSFIFSKVMQDEKLCKELLEIILDIDILRLKYIESEKTFEIAPGAKGVRLDVYVNDDKGTVYDIEMQATNTKELPKRSRFYQSMIDIDVLDKGALYCELKKSYIIFICLQDIFGKNRYVYTFRNVCVDDPQIELGDEATKIFLNPYGTGTISESLEEFFRYLREHAPTGNFTQALDASVKHARQNAAWRNEYMTIQNEIRMKEKDAYDRGHADGISQGTEQMASIVIRNMLLKGQSDEDIMSITECSKDKIDEIRRTMQ